MDAEATGQAPGGVAASQKMLVTSDPHETRIAVLEDDRLTEIFVERHRHLGLVGNVYKGRVTRVLPGMQAAFVDVGLERDAFLYVSDVETEDGAADVAAVEPGGGEPGGGEPGESAGESAVKREATGNAGDGRECGDGADPRTSREPQRSIDELLRPGQELIVQVVKDPLANKGARITTHATLPGRYLVLMPTVRHFGVSRRIEDEAERDRLAAEIEAMGEGTPGGLIVRTVGEDRDRGDFQADLDYLTRLWEGIRTRASAAAAPSRLHREQDVALRVVRDLFSEEFSVLWVDTEETYERIVEFLDQVHPSLVGRVKLYGQERPLFERFGIESQIEAALRSKVWLKSGGYLVINPTEALVAIDVNTGRFVGKTNLEETVLKTNLEAVQEIVRQIRLRDLGGIIVLDLIDMEKPEHREQVFSALEAELERDRAKTKVLSISEFGLVEITRKRSRTNLERLLTQPCPYCQGTGRIRGVETICLDLRREVLGQREISVSGEVLLRVHPEVARALQGEEREVLAELERLLGTEILIQADPSLHHERFDVVGV